MKKSIISFALGAVVMFLVLVILSSLHTKMEQKNQETMHEDYVSSIEEDGCLLCGTGKVSYTYWGEDNVGILNLNTLDLLHLEINRYNDYGELIADQAGYMSTTAMTDSKIGSSAHAFVFPDSGFARLQISDAQYKIDRSKVEESFCQGCLDMLNDTIYESPIVEYAVISFEERSIHPLTQNRPWFSAGNYGIDCEYGDDIKLLVHCFRKSSDYAM